MSANWEQYFELKTKKYDYDPAEWYTYKDKDAMRLPSNLPMPPTDSFYHMFSGCQRLKDITALTNWDVSKVENMKGTFRYCRQLQDISALANWNVSNVKDMNYMFQFCNNLQDISALANWNVSNVESISHMFYDCLQLKDVTALANWDVYKIKNSNDIFMNCALPREWQDNAGRVYGYLSERKHNMLRKLTDQQISELQKENTELKSRLAYLEEKLNRVMSELGETVQWNS